MWSRTVLAAFGAVSVALAASQATGGEIIGAKFNHQLTPPEFCLQNKGKLCTWVLFEAQGRPGKETAPRDGIIDTIRLVACAPGQSFVLQVVRRQGSTQKFKVIRTGPVINYKGSNRNCNVGNNFDIETFGDLSVPIKEGDYLAVVATQVRFMNNSSSGPSKLFSPPLSETQGFRNAFNSSGFLTIQFELKDP